MSSTSGVFLAFQISGKRFGTTLEWLESDSTRQVDSHTAISLTLQVIDADAKMFPPPEFFQGSSLNFAENLLFPSHPDFTLKDPSKTTAVIEASETSRHSTTWTELRDQVRQFQASLLALEIKPGDRVAGYVGNRTDALVAMLATTSLGGVWTAVSTDTGVHAVLERLSQIEPKVLFADNAAAYNGKTHPTVSKIQEIVSHLDKSLSALVILNAVPTHTLDLAAINAEAKVLDTKQFLELGDTNHKLAFPRFPPTHPVYILYSSGTTGAPKCIVHGSAGTLLQHKKEHVLHCSITPSSTMLYFTTVSWMMWHWLVSALASGATLVLYDGSPFRYPSQNTSVPDDLAMARVIDELGITHFGTSAKYLSVLEQKELYPIKTLSLKSLEAIYSTGSPLAPSTFSWVYKAFPPTINLGSITGGTDIISLFGAPSPISPVYVGEIQKAGLGMAIQAWDYQGKDISATGEAGELVCVKPFPCQPVLFWGATGAAKYESSYFEKFPGIWAHGDFVRFNPKTGGLVMLGRSDGILKPSGVRFGSAEIYNVLLQWFPIEIADALCIGRRRESDIDETVVLFLKMADGKEFTPDLSDRIKAIIRKELSARHVPGIIDECPEIPVTSNGKK
jgi:acetoacetyl-CoA synthetase